MNVLTLAGIAALIAVLIEIAKKFHWIPDGYAGWAAVVANIVVFAIAAVAGYLEFDLTAFDELCMMLAELLLSISGSFATHKLGRNMQIW
jgi:predicted anti-sigma-YlaC factor YlaD